MDVNDKNMCAIREGYEGIIPVGAKCVECRMDLPCTYVVDKRASEAARKRIQRPRRGDPGAPPKAKRSKINWKEISDLARDGLFESIPPSIYQKYQRNIHMIREDVIRRSHQAALVAPPLFPNVGAEEIRIDSPNTKIVP